MAATILVGPEFFNEIKRGLPRTWLDPITDIGDIADRARNGEEVCRRMAARALASLEASAEERIGAAYDRQGSGGLHGDGVLWVPGLASIKTLIAILQDALAMDPEQPDPIAFEEISEAALLDMRVPDRRDEFSRLGVDELETRMPGATEAILDLWAFWDADSPCNYRERNLATALRWLGRGHTVVMAAAKVRLDLLRAEPHKPRFSE